MARDAFTYMIGGKAGEGVKKAGSTAANMFAAMGRHVFQMDDYPSLIRGGHNFSVVSTSTREILSHYMGADVVVALDERSYVAHGSHVRDGGVMIFNSDAVKDGEGIGVPMTTEAGKYPNAALRIGVTGIAALCAAVGMSQEELSALIEREYRHDLEDNVAFASAIHEHVRKEAGGRFTVERGGDARRMFTGNEAIALGAAAAGLDMYIGYPMTPASTVLHFLAAHDTELGVTVIHPESEIAVANMAVGAAAAGARVMVGTSGGGFALMEEAFSFAGMAEAPFMSVLSSRPGPSTGVPTYTEQADLRFALGQGHGDFPRVIASPGTVAEAFRLSAEMLALVWTYQAAGILLTEKHLSESRVTTDIDVASAAWAEPVAALGRRLSAIPADGRRRVAAALPALVRVHQVDQLRARRGRHHHGRGRRDSGHARQAGQEGRLARRTPARGEDGQSVRERRSRHPDLRFDHHERSRGARRPVASRPASSSPSTSSPFPCGNSRTSRTRTPIVVEQSSTAQFATLVAERTGVSASDVILRYDGRAFEPEELADDIRKAIG